MNADEFPVSDRPVELPEDSATPPFPPRPTPRRPINVTEENNR